MQKSGKITMPKHTWGERHPNLRHQYKKGG